MQMATKWRLAEFGGSVIYPTDNPYEDDDPMLQGGFFATKELRGQKEQKWILKMEGVF